MISTGTARVLELLRDRRWHSSAEIEQACRVTCHSRLADLRREGHVIQKRRNPGCTGREMFSWRLTADAIEVADAREALVDTETGSSPLSVSTSAAAAPIQSPEPRPAPDPAEAPPESQVRRPLSVDEVVELLGWHGLVELVIPDQLDLLGVAA